MRLARTLRFDDSDDNVFAPAAEPGEWAVSGAFAFSNLQEADLTGKTRQAFANGWLGLESFGRATFVAVADITDAELARVTHALAQHFVEVYGAPSVGEALPVAAEEIGFMREMCDGLDPNTLLVVERGLTESGVSEKVRTIKPSEASLDIVAVHGERGD